ncbi:MAG: DUF938 domain-containing protein [Myxococcales bacterium]|nr:DUF938 domain-containing protein [Myxococcales bacterium]
MKQIWSAPQRNAAPILEVLRKVLPAPGLALEIASGSGQHAAHFCKAMPAVRWQPSDIDESVLPSIDAWRAESGMDNFLPSVLLDVSADEWAVDAVDAIFCANMIHISPWESCLGLFRGAGRLLPQGGAMILYGPFIENDVETGESNLRFDKSLKSRNATWGLRQLEEVKAAARAEGLVFDERIQMPANNLCAIFRREP